MADSRLQAQSGRCKMKVLTSGIGKLRRVFMESSVSC